MGEPWWAGGRGWAAILMMIDHKDLPASSPEATPPPSNDNGNGHALERDLNRFESEGGPPSPPTAA